MVIVPDEGLEEGLVVLDHHQVLDLLVGQEAVSVQEAEDTEVEEESLKDRVA